MIQETDTEEMSPAQQLIDFGVAAEDVAMYEAACDCSSCDEVVDALDALGLSYSEETRAQAISIGGAFLPAQYTARSQKARGVIALGKSHVSRFSNRAAANARVYHNGRFHRGEYSSEAIDISFPFFARPCPLRPRHGFVDSRPINDMGDWQALLADIAECDEPDCEVLCMPFINDGEFSAVITPGGIALGPGHDGATSGHNSFSIPTNSEGSATASGVVGWWDDLARAKYGIENTPYFEIVNGMVDGLSGKTNEIVQVRDGPEVKLSDSHIPKRMTVKNVVEACGDLLEWETIVADLPRGTAVYHPGGNMSSHYAVHCAINKVPILCARKPVVGEVLVPDDSAPILTEEGAAEIALLMPHAYKLVADSLKCVEGSAKFSDYVKLGIGALHASTAWGSDHHLLKLRAVGAAAILLAAPSACLGEMRHWRTNGPGRHNQVYVITGKDTDDVTIIGRSTSIVKPCPSEWIQMGGERAAAFTRTADAPIPFIASELLIARDEFNGGMWGNQYGGTKWGTCTSVSIDLISAMGSFVSDPTVESWGKVLTKINTIVNTSHNTGSFLNKFVANEDFDQYALEQATAFSTLAAFRTVTALPEEGAADFIVQVEGAAEMISQPDGALNARNEYVSSVRKDAVDSFIKSILRTRAVEAEERERRELELLSSGVSGSFLTTDSFDIDIKPTPIPEPMMNDAIAAPTEHKIKSPWGKQSFDRPAQVAIGAGSFKVQVAMGQINRDYGFTYNAKLNGDESDEVKLRKYIKQQSTQPSLAKTNRLYAPVNFMAFKDGSALIYYVLDGVKRTVALRPA